MDIEELCPEWRDDERMNVLFAPLRKKEVNPDSYDSKVKFWTNLIEKWSRESSTIIFNVSDLKEIFQRGGKSPYCLAEVLDEGAKLGALMQPEHYIQGLQARHQTWSSWALGLTTSAIKSVGAKVFGSSSGSRIFPKIADEMKTKLHKELQKCDRLVPSTKLSYLSEAQVSLVLDQISHQASRQFCLQALLEEKKLAKFTIDEQTFYKLASEDACNVDDVDKGLVHLKLNLDHLAGEVPRVEVSIQQERASAKKHLKSGSKAAAKQALRRQKRLEARLDKLHQQQLNLEQIYHELITAETNSKILQAYDSGLSAMKKLVDVSVLDTAESTMSNLAEIMDVNCQVSDTISGQQSDVDIDDLEKELADLLSDDVADPIAALSKTQNAVIGNKSGMTAVGGGAPRDITDGTSLTAALINLEKLDLNDLDDLEPVIGAKKQKIHVS